MTATKMMKVVLANRPGEKARETERERVATHVYTVREDRHHKCENK